MALRKSALPLFVKHVASIVVRVQKFSIAIVLALALDQNNPMLVGIEEVDVFCVSTC